MNKFLIAYDVTQEVLDESLVDNSYDKIRREIKRTIFSHYKGKEISRNVWVGEFVSAEGESELSAKNIKLIILRALKAKHFDEETLKEHVRLFISLLPNDATHIMYQNPACDENVKNSLKVFLDH